jgi:hypothetical protein
MLGCYLFNKITIGFGLSNNFKIRKTCNSGFSKKLQTINKVHQITNKEPKFYKRVFDQFLDFKEPWLHIM